MIVSLTIIGLAMTWLGYETNWMRVRLLAGKEIPRSKLKMTIAEWAEYDKNHARELESARREYAKQQAYYKAHTCPTCENRGADVIVETKTTKAGNSTCHITGCPDCLAKLEAQIIKSQQPTKPRNPYRALPSPRLQGDYYSQGHYEPSIEIKVDGQPVLELNGDYKRGMIKDTMRQYCRPGEVR